VKAIGCLPFKIDRSFPDAVHISPEVARARHFTLSRLVKGPAPCGIPVLDRRELVAHGRSRPPAQSEDVVRGERQSHHAVPRYPLAIARRQNGRSSTARANWAGAFIRPPPRASILSVDRRSTAGPTRAGHGRHRAALQSAPDHSGSEMGHSRRWGSGRVSRDPAPTRPKLMSSAAPRRLRRAGRPTRRFVGSVT
jgi:hypothetical protein